MSPFTLQIEHQYASLAADMARQDGDASSASASAGTYEEGSEPEIATVRKRLSELEVQYLERYALLRQRHLDATVLSHMPDIAKKSVEDRERFADSMKPSMLQHVFTRIRDIVDGFPSEDGVMSLEAGKNVLVQYRFIRPALLEGRAVLS